MKTATRHRAPRGDLAAALEQALERRHGSLRRVRRLRRRISPYASSCAIENLSVELDDGQTLSVVFKDLSPASLLAGARRVRPEFYYAPSREIVVYETILPALGLGTAACYASVNAAAQGRHWLFLERVRGPLLNQVGRVESWTQAARWLAQLHGRPAGLPRRVGAQLVRHDAAYYRLWLARAEEFLRLRRGRIPPALSRRFLRLAGRYDRLIGRLLEMPTAFIHGEFYPSNIIVGAAKNAPRICPVDWELAGIAPSLIDLAALTAGEWDDEDRQRMVAAYRDALEPVRGWPPSQRELGEALACCQLHWCVKWLGWAPDWSPPAHHAQDWLAEALRLAERVGL